MDASTYYGIVGDAMLANQGNSGGDEKGPEMTPEMRLAVSSIMQELSKLMDRLSVDIMLTERGVEIPTTITLVQ